MRFLPAAVVAFGLVAFSAVASAETLKVPSEAYPTIQSAVDAADDGDTVLVSAGTYVENVLVGEKSGLSIKGKGYPTIQPDGGVGITVVSSEFVDISGLEVYQADSGFVISNSTDIKVSKMVVSGSTNYAFSLNDNTRVWISRCEVNGAGSYGVYDSSSTQVIVEKCTFTGIGSVAVYLSTYNLAGNGSDEARVSKNRIVESSAGIYAGGSSVVIEKNNIQVSGGYGVYFDSSTSPVNAVVSKNIISTAGSAGIQMSGGGHAIVGNRVTGGGMAEYGYNNILDRNSVTGASFGILANGSSTTVTRNSIRDINGVGISINNYFLAVDRNSVSNTATEGIVVSAPGQSPITGNKVKDSNSSGIRVNVSGTTFIGNKVTNADFIGFYVLGTGNTFSKNKASGSGVYDLGDPNAVDANTYTDDNKFGTSQIPLMLL